MRLIIPLTMRFRQYRQHIKYYWGDLTMEAKKAINVEVGANIRAAREFAGYTQEQLSELIGLTPKTLSAAERGLVGVSLTTIRNICSALSISSDALIFGVAQKGDVGELVERLEQLSPAQFKLVKSTVLNLLTAFSMLPDGYKAN